MNERMQTNKIAWSAKELARISLFVGMTLAAQYVLSAIPGVELVTLLFAVFSFVYGAVRGVIAAVAFSLLRQLLFGFFPTVLVLYLLYYPLLACAFALLGTLLNRVNCQGVRKELFTVGLAILLACVCTVLFTLLDDAITPWLLSYTPKAAELYFKASLPLLAVQVTCAAISVGVLFFPLLKALSALKSRSL